MYCAYHPTSESVSLCHACGKQVCAECRRDVRGLVYCTDCLAAAVQPAPVLRPPKSPGLAAFLSAIVPGLGAIYNGQYVKAVIFVAVFAGLIGAADSVRGGGEGAFTGMSIAAFWFFMIFDGYRSAMRINAGPGAAEQPELPFEKAEDSLGWGIGITVLGVLFLLRSFGWIHFGSIVKLWPLIIIVVGIYMLRNYFIGSDSDSKGVQNV